MASSRIEKNKIAAPDSLDNLIVPAKEALSLYTQLDKVLNDIAKTAKSQLKFKTDSRGMREQLDLQQKLAKAAQASQEIDRVTGLTKKQRQAAEESLQRQRERGIAQMQREAKAAAEAERPYNKASKTLNELRKSYKDLAVSGLENSKAARAMKVEIDKLDSSLKKVDADAGQYQRNVGNYTKQLGVGFKSVLGFASQLGVAFSGFSLARGAAQTIVEFDNSIRDLQSILGVTDEGLKFFKESAIELGKNVKGGATAVVEAYKLIGSAKPELLENADALNEVTKATILLSKASGMELPDAATALTDAMNQFGAGADQAGKFVDVLAAGAKAGAAEVPQITEALLRFGAVAKTSNISIQESTALIEDLAEKGLKGADAGTALRNVMLKLSAPDALPKEAQERLKALGVNFDDLRDKSKPFSERLEALKPLLSDNAALVKVFGTENAVAATTLLSTTGRIKELTKAVDENGVAQDQANARSKTISEALNTLKETFNSLVLEFTSGANASDGVVQFIDFLSSNLPEIISLLLRLTRVFIEFKTVMFALRMKDRISEFNKFNKATKEGGKNMSSASSGARAFGQSLKGIGLTLAIDLFIELATSLYDVATGADVAAAKLEAFEKLKSSRANTNNIFVKGLDLEIEKQREALELLVAKGDLTEKQAALELKRSIIDRNYSQNFERGENQIDIIRRKLKDIDADIADRRVRIANLEKDGAFKNRERIGALEGEIDALLGSKFAIQEYNAELQLEIRQLDLGILGIKKEEKETRKSTVTKKEATKALKQYNDELFRSLDATRSLSEEDVINNAELNTESAIETQRKAAQESGEYQIDLIDELIAKEEELKRAIIERNFADETFGVDLSTPDGRLKQEAAERNRMNALEDLEEEYAGRRSEIRKELEMEQEGYADRQYQIEKATLDKIEEERKKKEDAERERLKKQAEFRNKLIEKITEYEIKKIDEQIEMQNKRAEAAKSTQDMLTELANQGNINAQQSIIAQQRIQEDAERKRMQLERRKANLLAFSTTLQTYNNKLAEGDKNPVLNTVADVETIFAFLNALPKFKDGTVNTGKGGGMDKDGGFAAMLHPEERVMDRENNLKTKGMSNDMLADLAYKHNTGQLIERRSDTSGKSWDIKPIIEGQKEVVKAINSLPSKDLNVHKLAEGMYQMTSSRKVRNTRVNNVYIQRK